MSLDQDEFNVLTPNSSSNTLTLKSSSNNIPECVNESSYLSNYLASLPNNNSHQSHTTPPPSNLRNHSPLDFNNSLLLNSMNKSLLQQQKLLAKNSLCQNDFQNQMLNVLNQQSNGMNGNSKMINPQSLMSLSNQNQHSALDMLNNLTMANNNGNSMAPLFNYLNSSSNSSGSNSSASSTSSATLLNQNTNSQLANNTTHLVSMLQQQSKWSNLNNKCTSCQEKNESICYCHDCHEKLCHSCFITHQRVILYKDHRVQYFLDSNTNQALGIVWLNLEFFKDKFITYHR